MTSTDSVESTPLTSCLAEGVLVQTDSQGRLRVSREKRKAVLARFEQSGMSAAKFAAVAGIKYSTFAGWVQRYRRGNCRVSSRKVRFIEAVVGPNPNQPGSQTGLMVHLPGSVRVELSSLTDVPLVAALIEALLKAGIGSARAGAEYAAGSVALDDLLTRPFVAADLKSLRGEYRGRWRVESL